MARQSNLPTHDVCFVKDRKGRKGFWTTIGAAWLHEDANGLSMQLDFMPTDLTQGHFVIRVRTPKQDETAEAEVQA